MMVLLAVGSTVAEAQTVVQISQVLPFSPRGTVVSLTKGQPVPASVSSASSSSTGEAAIPSAALPPPTMVEEGGRVLTGANSATSLFLGTAGTARLGAGSELQVPAATDKDRSLEMVKGSLFLNIDGAELKKRGGTEFRLKTPAALLAVKGTKFFTVTDQGTNTDTIGVHEGSVTVTSRDSGQSVTLEAGSAVSVSPSILGEPRPLTDDEQSHTAEYTAASLVRTPLPAVIKSPVPNTGKLRILLLQNGQASVAGEEGVDRVQYGTMLQEKIGPYLDWRALKSGRTSVPVTPQLTPDGTIRYAWAAKEPSATYQCYFDFGGHSGTNYSDENYSRLNRINPPPMPKNLQGTLVGIQFRMRGSNISAAHFVTSSAGFHSRLLISASSGLASPGSWSEVIMPALRIPAFKTTPARMVIPYSHLQLSGSFFKPSVPRSKTLTLDLAEFVLLTTPQ